MRALIADHDPARFKGIADACIARGHLVERATQGAAALETAPDLGNALAAWERRERPLTEHTQRWTRIYGTTIFLPKALKQSWILVERNVPWIGAQYLKAANHWPTGCEPSSGGRSPTTLNSSGNQ